MIRKLLDSKKKIIDRELIKYFRILNKRKDDILFGDFLTEFEEFILNKNAKRLHSILLIEAFNGIINPMYLEEQIKEIRKVSMSIELLHNAHLIQDDLIDDDAFRRGSSTFHKQIKKEIKNLYKNEDVSTSSKDWEQYGKDIGILGGTYAYLLGLDIIRSSNFPQKLKIMAIDEYTEAMDSILKGQIIEEYMQYHHITMSLEQYLTIAEMERARTFDKAVRIGAILANGNLHYQIKPLSNAMLKIGQAHAIKDDIIDIKEDIIGKKKKIIYILAVKNTNEDQSKILNEIYRKDVLNENDVEIVYNIFKETKVIKIAEQLAKNLVFEAKLSLKEIYPDLNREQKEFFNNFTDYLFET
ncbi:MAG: polyprenyl synthetase family protein [Candidatus Lokiarchaeota archaeon]|nr:polyprenyl synthetase family protein [Candidatus Lokiarchaeota archaeon]